jgi:hypothetical protein
MVAVVCVVLQHACVIATKDAITYETTEFSALPRCSSSELVLLHEMTDTNTINVINEKIYVRLKLRNLDLMRSNANYSMTGYKFSMKWILLP